MFIAHPQLGTATRSTAALDFAFFLPGTCPQADQVLVFTAYIFKSKDLKITRESSSSPTLNQKVNRVGVRSKLRGKLL